MDRQRQIRSEGVGPVLAFLPGLFGIWGVGYIYAGKLVKGLFFFFLGLLLEGALSFCLVAFFNSEKITYKNNLATGISHDYNFLGAAITIGVAELVLLIFQVFDTRSACQEANREV